MSVEFAFVAGQEVFLSGYICERIGGSPDAVMSAGLLTTPGAAIRAVAEAVSSVAAVSSRRCCWSESKSRFILNGFVWLCQWFKKVKNC